MLRSTLMIATSALLLAGCAGNYPGYPDHARNSDYRSHDRLASRDYDLTRHGDEYDYEMRDEVLFRYNSAEASPRAADIITQIAAAAREHPRSMVQVLGFTDTAGSKDYNKDLSRARADTVARLLADNGVNPDRIDTRGLGESHLAQPTADNVPDPLNRRVVIRIIPRT